MASKQIFCQVDRCIFKAYDGHRVCKVHSIASTAIVAGVAQRFCHYCREFHPLLTFVEQNFCRRQLADHNRRQLFAYLSLGRPGDSLSSTVENSQSDMMPSLISHRTTSNHPPMQGPDALMVPAISTGASASAAEEGSSSSTESSPPSSPKDLCDSIIPGSERTNLTCPDCDAEVLRCSDGSFQCMRRPCWAKFTDRNHIMSFDR